MFEVKVSEDVQDGLVVEPVHQGAEFAAEGQTMVVFLDVLLGDDLLPGDKLPAVGAGGGEDTAGSLLPLLGEVLPVFGEERGPPTGAVTRQSVLTELTAQSYLVQDTGSCLGVIVPEVFFDTVHGETVREPQTGRAESLIGGFGTEIAADVSLGLHLLQPVSFLAEKREVCVGHGLVVDDVVVVDELVREEDLRCRVVAHGLALHALDQDVVVGLDVSFQLAELHK